MSQSSLHQWALYYASRGWKVFPLKEHTPLPITQHGLHDATSDPAKINEWWSAWPNANIAVNLEASGLMAFDVDPQNGGDKTAAEHFPGLKSELTADTPSGGTHSIFSVPEGVEVPGRYGVGIDGKWKGYILLQPSYRKNFKDKPDGGYKWRPGFEGLPPALPEQLRKAPRVARERIAIEHVGSLADVAEIQECLASLDASYYEEQQWVHVGMALHHWESNTPDAEGVGFQLFDEWSSNDPDASRYVPHNIEVLWDRLNAGADGAITLGSLKHWAGKTAEQQHRASMSMARAAFAKMGAEELGKQWTTTSRDPMPCMLEPGEYTASVATNAPTAAYVQALNVQDWPRMIRILAYQFGSNCEKVLAELKQNPLFVETVELRDLIAVTCKATEKWASGSEATFALIPEGVKMTTEKPLYGAEKQLQIFKGCAFVGNHGKIYLPDGSLYDQNAFNGFMPAGVYSIGDNETTKKPWDAFIYQLKFTNVRVHDLAFRPDLPPGAVFEDEGFRYINSFVPVPMRKVDADVTPFLDHLALMLPVERDREILLAYMAAVVQYPGTKFRWAPVIQGAEGNGKGLVMTVLQKAIGTRFFHLAQAADMGNKFNDWIVGKLLVGVSEMNIAAGGVDLIDSLKTMITDDYAAIQGKGQKQATARVFANFIFTTNRQGAVGKAASGRRYAVFYTAQQEDSDVARDMGNRYFLNLHKWLDQVGFMALNNYLSSYAIPDHLNPATECVTAPRTSSFAASVEESKGVIEQAIEEAVAEGRIGFREPFISSHFLGELMSKMNRGTAVGDKKRPALLAPLGYIPHPALNRGRATRHLIPDNKKIVLYVLKNHPAAQLNDKDAQARYELKNQPGLSDLINKSA